MTMLKRDIMGGMAKGLTVIETFTADRPRQSITEVSITSGLDRATARRCLLTLAHLGYADYDGKYFTLTPRVLRLGTACLAAMPLPQLVQPQLDHVSEHLGESSSVSILDGTDIVYVARAAQKKVMSITLMPGSRLPAYCTSMGRVLLSALPAHEARAILAASTLAARTINTLTEPEALMSELARVRNQGFALNDQETELGLRSIAVPLFNLRGATVAAMNIGVPSTQIKSQDLVTFYLSALHTAQAEIRTLLR